ncbi:MAG: polysaccharide deacetylase family protein [Butyrivibrio sp.]|nr:polysaccharide deacetylase family protein [Muribaculum sp.]MCM1553540.1 polysaccharide deacetylase family protein [Butyrivibrio sp.]
MKKTKTAILIFDITLGLLFFMLILNRLSASTRETRGNSVIMKAVQETAEGVAEEKKIALTFDDGPHPQYTEQLLDGLKERGVHATFFVTGEHAKLHPDVIARMQSEGHLIGNHTYSHMQLTKSNRERFKEELIATNEVLEEITGEEVEFVRPPYGSWDKSFEKELNMFPVLWTVDPLDWSSRNVSSITEKIMNKAGENDIILMHDYYETSVTAALKVVDELQAEGYTFVTVEEILFD